MKKQEYEINGFIFKTEREARLAKKEVEGIHYVKSKVDLNNPDTVLELYRKVIEQELFQTPVGISFLKEMQEYLEAEPYIRTSEIPPIPIRQEVIIEETLSEKIGKKKLKLNKIYEINYKKRYFYSVTLNVILVFALVAMFFIINTSGNVNIINYENRLVDKYEEWVQELEQREKAIELREKELGIK
ncbi:hypothetical protein [Anaerosacchariphilus polymeriproducens]|uniref:Uncharacterized protein n=1 Tax=Anaerosacchariphilus polymeriproducens TaxID=1812858 RepID=A0A371AZ19_9FIRM|nr:hypothetical protein [Anaerosacchariphilus polymeriproducens]RDU24796.1 hypothetical protein DWV06_02130 [Anaerosacchariphilus polymeriproducens]